MREKYDDLNEPSFLESPKSPHQIAFKMVGVDFTAFEELAVIKASQVIKLGLILGAIDFSLSEGMIGAIRYFK